MALIGKPDINHKLNPLNQTNVPSMELPSFRFLYAQQERTLKNVLIRTPYALGDCICAEPAIRYAAKNFKDCTVSLVTPYPELFTHIGNIKKVYNTNKQEKPNWDLYYVLECYHAADSLQSEFVHNFNMSIDDYIAVSLFKGMIPVTDRNIVLTPSEVERRSIPRQNVVIHPGRHWVSKTFPKKWWDSVIHHLLSQGIQPAIIGADMRNDRGTVDVDATHCLDLRNKLTIMQSIAVLQDADVVLTNDSAPYHMACSGRAHVGVFSTVRHFDFIGHWRRIVYNNGDTDGTNGWNYKTEDLAHGTMWKDEDVRPTRNGGKYDVIDYQTLMSWLPEPKEVCEWTMDKLGFQNHAKVNPELHV